jgi:hypothetical protein
VTDQVARTSPDGVLAAGSGIESIQSLRISSRLITERE